MLNKIVAYHPKGAAVIYSLILIRLVCVQKFISIPSQTKDLYRGNWELEMVELAPHSADYSKSALQSGKF